MYLNFELHAIWFHPLLPQDYISWTTAADPSPASALLCLQQMQQMALTTPMAIKIQIRAIMNPGLARIENGAQSASSFASAVSELTTMTPASSPPALQFESFSVRHVLPS